MGHLLLVGFQIFLPQIGDLMLADHPDQSLIQYVAFGDLEQLQRRLVDEGDLPILVQDHHAFVHLQQYGVDLGLLETQDAELVGDLPGKLVQAVGHGADLIAYADRNLDIQIAGSDLLGGMGDLFESASAGGGQDVQRDGCEDGDDQHAQPDGCADL